MTNIVNPGSTLTINNTNGLTLTTDGTVPVTSLLDGTGTIIGNFTLLALGTISSDAAGGLLSINTGTLSVPGTLFANNESLVVRSGVVIMNESAGTLTGGSWQAAGAGTLTLNSGAITTDNATITLSGGNAALFDGGQSIANSLTTVGTAGVLNLLSGANFDAGNSLVVSGTIHLGGGTLAAISGTTISATGTIAGSGALDPGTPVVDNGLIDVTSGSLTVPGSGSMSGGGTMKTEAGASLVLQAFGGAYAEPLVNNGTIDAAFGNLTGTLTIPSGYSGTGGFLVLGGFDSGDRTILELSSGISGNVGFETTTGANFGELLLDSAASFNGTLTDFGNTDTIVMPGISNASTATLAGNVLSVKTSGGSVLQTLTLNTGSMNYGSATFTASENLGNNQATVKVSNAQVVTCFAGGTRIRTERGDVAVEDLLPGDVVPAHFAGAAKVVWLGHRHVACHRHPSPREVWPVRIAAHAFGPRLPYRDLLLSPDHAVFAGDVLIPIRYLINGTTIRQREVDTVTYYHVELAEHDVLLAEGMPVESYLENGDRHAFDNGGAVVALHPEFGVRRWEAMGCAEIVVTGPRVAAVVAALRARAEPPRRRARAMA